MKGGGVVEPTQTGLTAPDCPVPNPQASSPPHLSQVNPQASATGTSISRAQKAAENTDNILA